MPNWLKFCFLGFGLILAGYAVFFYPEPPETPEPKILAPAEPSRTAARRIYKLCTTEAETLREEMLLADMLHELNQWLRPHEIVVNIKAFKDIAAAREGFAVKAVDMYYDSPVLVSVFCRDYGMDPVLIRHRDGVERYHGVIFTSAKSAFLDLGDLHGASFAAESPLSTSTYFLPLDMAMERGLRLAPLEQLIDRKDPEALNVIISEQESVSLMWVLDQRVDAGAMKNTRFDALDEAVRDRLRELARTPDVPRELVAFSRQIDPIDRDLLIAAFVALEETARGRAALRTFQRTTEFRAIESPEVLSGFLQRVISRPLPFPPE